MDCIEIGPVPSNEACQQVGTRDYDSLLARKECEAFRNQIRRVCGPEPLGARVGIKSNPHDFGSYYEVVVYFKDSEQAAIDYAFRVESTDIPEWDAEAKKELGIVPPSPDFTKATAYVEWGGAYDTRHLELIEYEGRYSYEDKTGGYVSLTQDSTYETADAAKSALIIVVFSLGEKGTYIDFGTGGIVKR